MRGGEDSWNADPLQGIWHSENATILWLLVSDTTIFCKKLFTFTRKVNTFTTMELGERIKKLRQAAGLTQKQVGEKGGFDKTMLSKIEHHNQNPSLELLRRVARGIGCSVVDLLDEEDKRPRKIAP